MKLSVAKFGGVSCLFVLSLAFYSADAFAETNGASEKIETLGSPLINGPVRVIDLSHVQSNNMPAASALSLPSQKFFMRLKKGDAYNIENITYTPHTGTHMDAPYHVFEEGISVESMDPTVLIGPATVVSLDVSGDYVITAKDIKEWEANNTPIQKGDAVLFNTGQDKLWSKGNDAYMDGGYPTLSTGAANYLIKKNARYVGVEAISPDGAEPKAHKILLGHGVPVVENLTHLDSIGVPRFYSMGTFPAVDGATGVWVRLLALVPQ